jgi:DNA-binding Lrp family transcriptional regulator
MSTKNIQKLQILELDKKDKRILYELDKDGRAPLARIAKKAGLSRQSAQNRMNSLLRRGAFWGFLTFIDYSRLGFSSCDVWIQLRDISLSKKKEFIHYLLSHPNTMWISEFVGKWDMCVSLLARNIGHFYKMFDKVQDKFPAVIRDYTVSFNVSGTWHSRTHLIDDSRLPEPLWHWESDLELVKTDKLDRKILALLAENARIPTREIARRLSVDPGTVVRRVKRLEQKKVIQGYHALSEGLIFGFSRYEILVKFRGMSPKQERSLEEFCASNSYLYFYIKCVGRWDADIVAEVKSTEHLQSMLSEMREKFPDTVLEYEAVPVIKEHRMNFFPGSLL